MGIPLTVGCFIGEASAGWVSDLIINSYAKRHNGYRKPEARLYLIPACLLLCIGTSTYGYCVQHKKPWIDAAFCMAFAGLGTQVGTTMVYTYCTDSYKPQAGEIGAVINLFKSGKILGFECQCAPLTPDQSLPSTSASTRCLLESQSGSTRHSERLQRSTSFYFFLLCF